MELKYSIEDTIEWMKSSDYKIRLKAEYWQLIIRMEKVRCATLNIGYTDLNAFNAVRVEDMCNQFKIMHEYKHILEKRAMYDMIDLDNQAVVMW